jgi:hypothetical protein
MALFKRKNKDEQPRTCPECCQIVAADATTCDLCGATLSSAPPQETTAPVAAGVERYS